jgi:hypothetical protein
MSAPKRMHRRTVPTLPPGRLQFPEAAVVTAFSDRGRPTGAISHISAIGGLARLSCPGEHEETWEPDICQKSPGYLPLLTG